MPRCIFFTSLMLCTTALAVAQAEPETGVRMTIYNDNFALVRDRRVLEEPLKEGLNHIRFRDVAGTIEPASVHFRSLTDPAATVVEQNYEYDLVNADRLLNRYIDRPIGVFTADGHLYEGTLMSFDERRLVLAEDRDKGPIYMVERGDNLRRVRFGDLPEGLLTRPTLVWQLFTRTPGPHTVEVGYLARQIRWQADYNVVLSPDDTHIDVSGWVTIHNHTGTTYRDAAVKLVAGDKRTDLRHRPFGYGQDYYKTMMTDLATTGERGEDVSRALGDLRIYTLDEKTTVNHQQVKQIELITASEAPVTRTYLYDGAKIQWGWFGRHIDPGFGREENTKVNVLIEIENRADRNLGIALPAGKCRVFKRDTDGSLEFIGEDLIGHTARDERAVIYIGDAFDIVGERRQTEFRRISDRVIEEAFEIKVRNRKEDETVTVKVLEKLYRNPEWEIIRKSTDFEKLNVRTIIFPVEIEPDGEAVVTYRVRYRW